MLQAAACGKQSLPSDQLGAKGKRIRTSDAKIQQPTSELFQGPRLRSGLLHRLHGEPVRRPVMGGAGGQFFPVVVPYKADTGVRRAILTDALEKQAGRDAGGSDPVAVGEGKLQVGQMVEDRLFFAGKAVLRGPPQK